MSDLFNYDNYLKSPQWQTLRTERLKKDGFKCQHCGTGKNLRVHHVHYPGELGTESLDDLITLCDQCHREVHNFDKDTEKLSEIRYRLGRNSNAMMQGAFTFWAYEQTKRRNLSPFDATSRRLLVDEFSNIFDVDKTRLSEATLRLTEYSALKRRHYIDFALNHGKSAKEIKDKYGIPEKVTYKRRAQLKGIVNRMEEWK